MATQKESRSGANKAPILYKLTQNGNGLHMTKGQKESVFGEIGRLRDGELRKRMGAAGEWHPI
jgi:hypothetical protein